MYRISSTDEYDRWFEGQSEELLTEVLALLRLLEELGPRLGRPHADTLKGSRFTNMKELRVRTSASQVRIAFAFDPRREAVLLVAGDKQGVDEKRFYRQLIHKADRLYAAHLREING